MTGPLKGVRVVEVASFAFGPGTSAVLADWGAEVIKIEHPVGGDPVRTIRAWGVPERVDDVHYIFEFCNRGTRSVTLDVADPAGYDVLLRLVDSADVVSHEFPAPHSS
jgi:crotonobetainyl-CoA:carnitine CoA-transferase CaiB-like acyl-CoA transferase